MQHDLSSVNLLLHFKDMTQITLSKCHERNENFTKSVKNQLENIEIGMKTYIKTMIDVAEVNTKNEIEIFESKLGNIRMENHKYAVDLKNSATELKAEKEEVLLHKAEIYSKIEDSIKINEDLNSNTIDKFDRIIAEYDNIKAKFNEIAEFVKV